MRYHLIRTSKGIVVMDDEEDGLLVTPDRKVTHLVSRGGVDEYIRGSDQKDVPRYSEMKAAGKLYDEMVPGESKIPFLFVPIGPETTLEGFIRGSELEIKIGKSHGTDKEAQQELEQVIQEQRCGNINPFVDSEALVKGLEEVWIRGQTIFNRPVGEIKIPSSGMGGPG